jgi:hypothetical protein
LRHELHTEPDQSAYDRRTSDYGGGADNYCVDGGGL